MLCFPGFTPVANEVQAVADRGRIVEVRVPELPLSASSLKFFILPCSSIGRITSNVAPSSPTTTTFPNQDHFTAYPTSNLRDNFVYCQTMRCLQIAEIPQPLLDGAHVHLSQRILRGLLRCYGLGFI